MLKSFFMISPWGFLVGFRNAAGTCNRPDSVGKSIFEARMAGLLADRKPKAGS
jgi:hypothetical protein